MAEDKGRSTKSEERRLADVDLPAIGALTARQQRGVDCVHCGIVLTPETAIDLGEHIFRRLGQPVRWYPRSCRRH